VLLFGVLQLLVFMHFEAGAPDEPGPAPAALELGIEAATVPAPKTVQLASVRVGAATPDSPAPAAAAQYSLADLTAARDYVYLAIRLLRQLRREYGLSLECTTPDCSPDFHLGHVLPLCRLEPPSSEDERADDRWCHGGIPLMGRLLMRINNALSAAASLPHGVGDVVWQSAGRAGNLSEALYTCTLLFATADALMESSHPEWRDSVLRINTAWLSVMLLHREFGLTVDCPHAECAPGPHIGHVLPLCDPTRDASLADSWCGVGSPSKVAREAWFCQRLLESARTFLSLRQANAALAVLAGGPGYVLDDVILACDDIAMYAAPRLAEERATWALVQAHLDAADAQTAELELARQHFAWMKRARTAVSELWPRIVMEWE
jgi:hypothetical protein